MRSTTRRPRPVFEAPATQRLNLGHFDPSGEILSSMKTAYICIPDQYVTPDAAQYGLLQPATVTANSPKTAM
jgi:hypothetical protein